MAVYGAKGRPDLLVLPEAISMLCYPDGRPDFSYRDVAEAVPGPSTEQLCTIAKQYKTNLVVGLIADRGPDRLCQNVTVVINRAGEIVGQYEKIHEPKICRDEQDADVGSDIPVFDLDFGRIGIMVCWDLISPEIASILAAKGAQLICFPHLIGLPTASNFAIQLRARAVDNGVPIVAAGMRDAHNHNGNQEGINPTCIVDSDGRVIIQSDLNGADRISADVELAPHDSANQKHIQRRSTDLRFEVYAREYEQLAASKRSKTTTGH